MTDDERFEDDQFEDDQFEGDEFEDDQFEGDEHDDELEGDEGGFDELEGAEDGFDGHEDEQDSGLDTGETSGLGLTEEFARIEAEIEHDAISQPERPPPGEQPGPRASDHDHDPDHGEPDPGGPAGDRPRAADGAADDEAEEQLAEAEETSADQGSGDREAQEPDAEPESQEPDAEPEAQEPEPDPGTAEREPAAVLSSAAGAAGEHPVVRPMPRPAVPIGPTLTDEELTERTPKLWLRFLAGSATIIASMAAAVAITGILFLSDVAAKLQPIPGIGEQLEEVDPGAPQTILIIGSDRRAGDDPDLGARSDTTMLLRVDPEKEVLSLFSLPRDLKVDIPGVGVGKLNEAYTEGGEKKTLKTVSRFTGLEINHVVEINFSGFADAVNAIDCVYIDVDRDYFNDNAGIAPGTTDGYAEIDINSGYQRLCGLKALQYVRYRHADTDLVRAARQQDFLREARQKVEPKELLGAVVGVGTGNELIDIFTEYTRSDIDDEDDVIGILKSFASIRDVPVNEVHFEGDIGGPDDPFVTSTDKQVEKAIDQFLNGVGSEGQRGGEKANEKPDGGSKKKKKKEKDPTAGADVVPTDSLGDGKFPTLAQRFEADGAKNARRLGIPAFYLTEVVPGSAFSTGSRTYEYENEENRKESAYKTVISLTQPSTLEEYYGLMGTTWSDPPILREPSEVREIDGREYLLFYDGDRLRMVGWREKGNSYWLNNTLTQSIGEPEMLAMATSVKRARD